MKVPNSKIGGRSQEDEVAGIALIACELDYLDFGGREKLWRCRQKALFSDEGFHAVDKACLDGIGNGTPPFLCDN